VRSTRCGKDPPRARQILMPLGAYPFSERYGWVEDKYGLSWQLILRGKARRLRRLLLCSCLWARYAARRKKRLTFARRCSKVRPTAPELRGRTMADLLARYGEGEEPDKEGTVRYAFCGVEVSPVSPPQFVGSPGLASVQCALRGVPPMRKAKQLTVFCENRPGTPSSGQDECGLKRCPFRSHSQSPPVGWAFAPSSSFSFPAA